MVKKPSVHDFTGAVNVSGDVTPITRQPIDKVDTANWGRMSVSELHKQREILQQRYYKALSVGLGGGADTIKAGMNQIDAILNNLGDGDSLGFL